MVDSRAAGDGVRRRRECVACAGRFTTYERVERAALLVVKRDGRREPFSREKLLAGLRRACEKRPLPAGAVEALAAAVERDLDGHGGAELPSTAIGEAVIGRLQALDGIAYVRFASVYREFADLDSLREAVDELAAARRSDTPADPPVQAIAGLAAGISPASGTSRRRRRWAGRRPRDATRAMPAGDR